MPVKVCVIGAGVSGLSTAVQITQLPHSPEVDLRVTIIAEKFSPETTGDGAAGFWEPHLCGNTSTDKIMKWGRETFEHIASLARSADAAYTGALFISGASYFRYPPPELPIWKDVLYNMKEMSEADISRLSHLKDMNLRYDNLGLCAKGRNSVVGVNAFAFLINGGSLQQNRISSIKELAGEYDVVVNCTGVGATSLVPDVKVRPIKGQTVCVEAPWIRHFTIIDNDVGGDILHIIPKASYLVLGGTYEPGGTDITADVKERERILRECTMLEPSLKSAKILGDWVGFRPSRDEIRLERETLQTPNGTLQVVHNYGHGGSGITLHWGCAKEAANLVHKCVTQTPSKL